jgi:hypothetical protein
MISGSVSVSGADAEGKNASAISRCGLRKAKSDAHSAVAVRHQMPTAYVGTGVWGAAQPHRGDAMNAEARNETSRKMICCGEHD